MSWHKITLKVIDLLALLGYRCLGTHHLSLKEIEEIMDSPDTKTWSGRRDRTLLATLYNTVARVSEIVRINRIDIEDDQSRELSLHGKGRKQRTVPFRKKNDEIRRRETIACSSCKSSLQMPFPF